MDAYIWQCDICDRNFRSFQSRRQHLYSGVHGIDPYPYKCNGECGEEFHTEDELVRHINELHCIVCDRSFGTARSLQQHVRDSPSHVPYWEAYGLTDLPQARRRQRQLDRRHDANNTFNRPPSPDMPGQYQQPQEPEYATSLYEFTVGEPPTRRRRLASTGIEQQLLDAAAAEAALVYAQQPQTPEPSPPTASSRPASHGRPDFDFDFDFDFRAGLELALPRFIPSPDGNQRAGRSTQQRTQNLGHAGPDTAISPEQYTANPFQWLDEVEIVDGPDHDDPFGIEYERFYPSSSAESRPSSSIEDLADHVRNLAISPSTDHSPAETAPNPPKPPAPKHDPECPARPDPEPSFIGPPTLQDELSSMAEKMAAMQAKMGVLEVELATAKATVQREESFRQCGMCYERSTDSVTKCGHQFCGVCIDSWQAQHHSPWQTPCPMCRKPMGKAIKMYRTDSSP